MTEFLTVSPSHLVTLSLLHGDPIMQPDGRHQIQDAVLGQLFDVVGARIAEKNDFIGGEADFEVADAFAGAELDAVFELFVKGRQFADDHGDTCSEMVAKLG